MSVNPYQPPRSQDEPEADADRERNHARGALRGALVILLLPALFNYYAFDMQAIAGSRFPTSVAAIYRAINIFGFIVGAAMIWFFGLPLLERISQWVRVTFTRDAEAVAWNGALYETLRPAVYLALAGAFWWVVWIIGFYYLRMNFTILSWLVGIPAHLLCACLYVPLLWRWYKLGSV